MKYVVITFEVNGKFLSVEGWFASVSACVAYVNSQYDGAENFRFNFAQ